MISHHCLIGLKSKCSLQFLCIFYTVELFSIKYILHSHLENNQIENINDEIMYENIFLTTDILLMNLENRYCKCSFLAKMQKRKLYVWVLFNVVQISTYVTMDFENLKLFEWCRTHQGQIVLRDHYTKVYYSAASIIFFSF